MQRKKIIIIASIIVLILIPLFLVTLTNSTPVENNQQTPPPNDTNAPSLVIPESPLGIVSLVMACLAALSVFAISKKSNSVRN